MGSQPEPVADTQDLVEDLIFSGRGGDVDELRSLLAAGAPVDGRDAHNSTALMMAAANGHAEAMQVLLDAGADANATNDRKNTAMHWAVLTGQEGAIKTLLSSSGCDVFVKNDQGWTAAMSAERAGKGELVVLILSSLDDEDAAAAALGHGEEDEATEQVEQLAAPAGVDKTLGGSDLKFMNEAPAKGEHEAALPVTRGVLSSEISSDVVPPPPPPLPPAPVVKGPKAVEGAKAVDVRIVGLEGEVAIFNGLVGTLTGKSKGGRMQVLLEDGKKPYLLAENIEPANLRSGTEMQEEGKRRDFKEERGGSQPVSVSASAETGSGSSGAASPALVSRERPGDHAEIARRVLASGQSRVGDWRYSVLPGVVPRDEVLRLSTEFFATTGLLTRDGNTFGPEFEQQYAGHRNYFYYMNRNAVVPGAEKAERIFESLDTYTRQVIELHHPGVPVRLERAFGAYYEGERDGFHRGVNEHCDGDANLVSTVVHAVLPDGDVGFTEGGQLVVSEIDDLAAEPITHSNETVGSVVYLGGSVFHHASPIKMGGKRLVFCMFYAADDNTDLSRHALV